MSGKKRFELTASEALELEIRLKKTLEYMKSIYMFKNNTVNQQRAGQELEKMRQLISTVEMMLQKKDYITEENQAQKARAIREEFNSVNKEYEQRIYDFHKKLEEEERLLEAVKDEIREKIKTLEEYDIEEQKRQIINVKAELMKRNLTQEDFNDLNKKVDELISNTTLIMEQIAGRQIMVGIFKNALEDSGAQVIKEKYENQDLILEAHSNAGSMLFRFTLDKMTHIDSDFNISKETCAEPAAELLNKLYDYGLEGTASFEKNNQTVTLCVDKSKVSSMHSRKHILQKKVKQKY